MTSDCSSCDAHIHHAAMSFQEVLTCEDNSFEDADEFLQYLDSYLAELE